MLKNFQELLFICAPVSNESDFMFSLSTITISPFSVGGIFLLIKISKQLNVAVDL